MRTGIFHLDNIAIQIKGNKQVREITGPYETYDSKLGLCDWGEITIVIPNCVFKTDKEGVLFLDKKTSHTISDKIVKITQPCEKVLIFGRDSNNNSVLLNRDK